jgi:Holliday junction resolvase RusA-like endonuclease
VKLVIQGTLPTLNEMINAAKAHQQVYEKLKKKADHTVAWSAKAVMIKDPYRPVSADYEITWYRPDAKTDKDNVIAGQKFIFDGLQQAGLIKNDGWKQIGKITHELFVDKLNPRVEILITEVT